MATGDVTIVGPNGADLDLVSPSTSGYILTSNGPGVPPSFQPSGGGSGNDYVVMSDGGIPTSQPVNDGAGNFIYTPYVP